MWTEEPPIIDTNRRRFQQYVREWQLLKDKQDELLALIEQRRQATGNALISEEDSEALTEGTKVIRRLDAIITGVLEGYQAKELN